MDALSPILINKVLDGLSLRASVTAQNIANASSREFRPMEVRFEDALKAAASEGPAAIRDLSFAITRAPDPAFGTEPRLDLELATASETAMRYTALLDMLGREIQLARTVVRGGQ